MSVGSAVFPIHRWLHARLSGDATLSGLVGGRIYRNAAPGDATYPLLVWARVSDPLAAGGLNGWIAKSDAIYQVICYVEGTSLTPAENIINRVDRLLHNPGMVAPGGTVTGGVVYSCIKNRDIETAPEHEDGQWYSGVGAEYRIEVKTPEA